MVLTVLIGLWASRRVKNSRDFLVAGRNLPLTFNAAALFALWFGSETVFGAFFVTLYTVIGGIFNYFWILPINALIPGLLGSISGMLIGNIEVVDQRLLW